MSKRKRELSLNAFYAGTGHHEASWRVPGVEVEKTLNLQSVIEVAQLAEKGLLDAFFLADTQARIGRARTYEPFTLLSALAVHTKHIGLIATVHSTYNEPYHVARKFASLDHISKGRAGWNLVTGSTDGAENFNRRNNTKFEERYAIAEEFIQVATRLWDSWEDDAILNDKVNGRRYDDSKIHEVNFQGKVFKVKGPLSVARPPQGHPVIVQSGSSENGKNLAAQWGELIFTAQLSVKHAQEFYADVKGRLPKFGREPEDIKIAPGVFFILGETHDQALENEAQLNSFVDTQSAAGRLSVRLGIDLLSLPLDEPLSIENARRADEVNGARSRHDLILETVKRDNLTPRQIIHRLAGGRGHFHFVGTPAALADHIEEWFTGYAADAFNLMPSVYPRDFPLFIKHVVPELQRRGLFRTQYTGATLRENLGLKRPVNTFVRELAPVTAA